MDNINLKTRILLKNGIEADWDMVENFIPLKGEMIIYNADENHSSPRIKVGNGIDIPRNLPFINSTAIDGLVADRVKHKLTFGMNEAYQFDGSADVTVPVYMGEYN